MKSAAQITGEVYLNRYAIFSNGAVLRKIERGIEGYLKIQAAYENNQMDADFRRRFATFYRMNPKVSQAFKDEFFRVLQEMRDGEGYDMFWLLDHMYHVDHKNQFSFVTKLYHTAHTDAPIYDSLVKKVVELPDIPQGVPYEEKVMESFRIYGMLDGVYHQLLSSYEFGEVLKMFDDRFHAPISDVKKVDFILWAYGSTL